MGISFSSIGVKAITEVPYQTYSEDAAGNLILTQDAYLPVARLTNNQFELLKEMQLFDGVIYVLSQGTTNSSIIIYDQSLNHLHTITLPEAIIKPEGFYVTEEKIYITDLGVDDNGQIHIYDFNRDTFDMVFDEIFGKPDTPLFGESTQFLPKKIAVDPRGNIYIVSDGALNGVLQLSPTGRFFGFFGANRSDISRIRNLFATIFPTTQQLTLPPTPTELAIDDEGFIYTVTSGLSKAGLKKFNVASRNFLPDDLNVIQGNIDVIPGRFNNVYTLSNTGVIREYDIEGNMLFSFGGSMIGDTRMGLFQKPVAIIVLDDQRLMIADEQANDIQIFEYTEFAHYVHMAIENYQNVNFEEGIALWNDVLLYNAWFDLAYKGIGNAHLSQGNFREAMEAYKRTNDVEGYSDAFWELRNEYIESYVGILVILFFGVQVLYLLKRWYNSKGHKVLPESWHLKMATIRKKKLYLEAVQPLKIIRHPLDDYYDIKKGNHTSIAFSTVIYALIAVLYFLRLFLSNYIFIGSMDNSKIFVDLIMLYGGLSLFIMMNYLVCSIRDGSGRFKEVYMGVSHAILPIMMITFVMTIVSNVLTLNEIFIYTYIHQIGYVWTAILLYFMVKDIHHYDVGETFLNISVTMFSMVVLAFVVFMGYVIFNQSLNFFEEVIREAILRVQG